MCPQKSEINSPNSANEMKKTCRVAIEMNTENSNDEVLIAAISDNRSRELGTSHERMAKNDDFGALGIAMIDLSSPHELLLWNVIDSAHHVEENLLLEELQVWGLGNRSLIIGEVPVAESISCSGNTTKAKSERRN